MFPWWAFHWNPLNLGRWECLPLSSWSTPQLPEISLGHRLRNFLEPKMGTAKAGDIFSELAWCACLLSTYISTWRFWGHSLSCILFAYSIMNHIIYIYISFGLIVFMVAYIVRYNYDIIYCRTFVRAFLYIPRQPQHPWRNVTCTSLLGSGEAQKSGVFLGLWDWERCVTFRWWPTWS